MKLIVAFFRLIRSLNLLFIVLTQVLFQYCIIIPAHKAAGITPLLTVPLFILLVTASVFIGAAGYIINDYFDLNIDRINKPEKLVVDKIIKRRWTIIWHLVLSVIGIAISFYVGWKANHDIILGLSNSLSVLLLWVYSTTFKKKLLSGNIIISLLTAWVVLVLVFIEMNRGLSSAQDPILRKSLSFIFKMGILYGGFAFIISLIREVIKDIEDMAGDGKYGCRTMPLVWGIRVSKVFMATWLIVLIGAISILQIYVVTYGWWASISYTIIMILFPLAIVFQKLVKATTVSDFHKLSSLVKWVMMTGILSILFFRFYV